MNDWWFTKTKVFSPEGLSAWIVWLHWQVDGGAMVIYDSELSADLFLDLIAISHPANNLE